MTNVHPVPNGGGGGGANYVEVPSLEGHEYAFSIDLTEHDDFLCDPVREIIDFLSDTPEHIRNAPDPVHEAVQTLLDVKLNLVKLWAIYKAYKDDREKVIKDARAVAGRARTAISFVGKRVGPRAVGATGVALIAVAALTAADCLDLGKKIVEWVEEKAGKECGDVLLHFYVGYDSEEGFSFSAVVGCENLDDVDTDVVMDYVIAKLYEEYRDMVKLTKRAVEEIRDRLSSYEIPDIDSDDIVPDDVNIDDLKKLIPI